MSYEVAGKMNNIYSIKYSFFSHAQKFSDEELAKKIQTASIKKHGKDAVAADIYFVRRVKDTIDLIFPLTGSVGADSISYKIISNWIVPVTEK